MKLITAIKQGLREYDITWRQIEQVALQRDGGVELMSRADAKKVFDQLPGFDDLNEHIPPFYAWTKDYVVFVTNYHGCCQVDAVPRNPVVPVRVFYPGE